MSPCLKNLSQSDTPTDAPTSAENHSVPCTEMAWIHPAHNVGVDATWVLLDDRQAERALSHTPWTPEPTG